MLLIIKKTVVKNVTGTHRRSKFLAIINKVKPAMVGERSLLLR
jgi:hypothetical protein